MCLSWFKTKTASPPRQSSSTAGARNLLLLGLAESGKTTFREALKGNATALHAPNVGIEVDTVRHKSTDWQIVDVGGHGVFGPILPDLRDHHGHTSIVIYFHDCSTDDPRESLKCLKTHMTEMVDHGSRFLWIVLRGEPATVTEKDDGSGEDIVQDFYSILRQVDGRILYKVQHQQCFDIRRTPDARCLLDQICVFAAENHKFQPSIRSVNPLTSADSPSFISVAPEIVKASRATAGAPVNDGTAEESHKVQLRLMYEFLVEKSAWRLGIMSLTDTYLKQIAEEDRAGLAQNRTLLIFWLHRLKRAIDTHIPISLAAPGSEQHFMDILNSRGRQFHEDYWRGFYSDQLMQSSGMYYRLPDLGDHWRLHSITTKECIPCKQKGLLRPSDRLPRYAFAVVKAYMMDLRRRSIFVDVSLANLQAVTMRQRSKYPALEEYSETQTYFWIKFLHQLVNKLAVRKFAVRNGYHLMQWQLVSLMQDMDYAHFDQLVHVNLQAWKTHYSPELWHSLAARQSFKSPDLKSLVINDHEVLCSELSAEQCERIWDEGHIPELPSDEELSFQAALALRFMETCPAALKTTHLPVLRDIYAYLVENHENKHSWTLDKVNAALFDADAGHLKHAVPSDQLRFWIGKLMSILAQEGWKPPKSAIGNEISVFEQFRIVVHDNLWLVHEALCDVEIDRKQRLRELELLELKKSRDSGETWDENSTDVDDVVVVGSASTTTLDDFNADATLANDDADAASNCDTESSSSTSSSDEKCEWEVVMI